MKSKDLWSIEYNKETKWRIIYLDLKIWWKHNIFRKWEKNDEFHFRIRKGKVLKNWNGLLIIIWSLVEL